MEINTNMYKGRLREKRGRLKSFDDLPEFAKIDFINIKKIIDSIYEKNVDVYVHGSFNHGNWDEYSDYDVIINENPNLLLKHKSVEEQIGKQVHIISTQNKIGVILIP